MATKDTADEDDILLPEDTNADHEIEEDDLPAGEEGEEEEEGEGEGEGEEEEEPARGNMIPRHRYDSAAQRAKEAEAKLAAYEAEVNKTKAKDPVDDYEAQLAELDLKQAKLLADGEYEAAAKIAQQTRAIDRKRMEEEFENRSTHSSNATIEQIRLDQAIDTITTTYSVLNPESEDYDQSAVDEVLSLQRAFVSSGKNPTQALHDAVHYARIEGTPAPAAEKKRKTDVGKNLDTQKRTPPDTGKAGADSDTSGMKDKIPDINSLSEEEFDALPEATLRRMRGDAH